MLLRSIVSFVTVLAGVVNAQLPIPEAPPGFTVGGGSADADVQLETYIDLVWLRVFPHERLRWTLLLITRPPLTPLTVHNEQMCPASKAAYPGLKEVIAHYKASELRVKFVLFPLPYHQHSFTAAESAFTITTALGDGEFTKWLEVMYENQERYESAILQQKRWW